MPAIELTPAQRKEKRADAHHLDPVVMIGNDGMTDAVVKEIDAALGAHGLIKVRVFSDDRAERAQLFDKLADQLGAAPIQHIGKLLVLWRPLADKPKAERADDRKPGPKVVKILKFSKSGNHRPQVKKIKILGNQRLAAGGEVKRARKRSTSVKKTVAD
ncbi:MAG: ribosome assembly RNA-binding protein YhbY [Ideonella sp.]